MIPSSGRRSRGDGERWRLGRRGDESLYEVEARSRAGDRRLSGEGERRRDLRSIDGDRLDDVSLSLEDRRAGFSESLRSMSLYDRPGGEERRWCGLRGRGTRSGEGERRREVLLSRTAGEGVRLRLLWGM